MRSVTVFGIPRGLFAFTLTLTLVLAGASISIARSGLLGGQGQAVCADATAPGLFDHFDRGPRLATCGQKPRAYRGLARRLNVYPSYHPRRDGEPSRSQSPAAPTPVPSVSPSDSLPQAGPTVPAAAKPVTPTTPSNPGTPTTPTTPTDPGTPGEPTDPTDPGDLIPPNTQIAKAPTSTTTATSASITFDASESGSSFDCKLDSGAWVECESPARYSDLDTGSHQFSVRATDTAGNTDNSPARVNWTVTEPTTPTPPASDCTTTVSSASAAQSALSSAAPGDMVCLADGTYGNLSLTASKAAPGATLTAANPGAATIGSVSVSGSGYTISRFVIDGGVTISRNTDRTVVDHNRILSGGHYGVFVCTAEPPDQCDDTRITGNFFDGAMNEDQIRANVFHDGDGDGIGLLVEGNEFRGNTERGGHNDVFQSVWVGDHLVFRKNYLHDFGGQGFFVKDQGRAIDGFIASNNLIVNQDLPCEPASLCSGYQLSPWQVFGPIANGEMNHNTVGWGLGGGTAVLTGTYTNIEFSGNVFNRLSDTDSGGSVPSLTGSENTYCNSSGWGVPPGSSKDCDPAFLDPAAGDYRLESGRGVNWTPAGQHYGP
jgi:hypothetical protein